jgi:riboflavin biosynthesis pyrimidine reductase
MASTFDALGDVLQDLQRARDRPPPQGRPFVTLAYAQSIDGSIARERGERYTLSGPDSLRLTHMLRSCHDAILVGVGTVLADDPALSVRMVEGRDPQPVVVDSQLRPPLASRLLTRAGRRPWIATAEPAAGALPAAAAVPVAAPVVGTPALGTAMATAPGPAPNVDIDAGGPRRAEVEARGCRVIPCPAQPNGWVDLPALLRALHAAGVAHVMVEGGARIITSFLGARLVDYAVVTIAPQFLGGLSAVGPMQRERERERGRALAADGPSPRLGPWISARLGDDLVLSGEVRWPTA